MNTMNTMMDTMTATSTPFSGPEVRGGRVQAGKMEKGTRLTLTSDFVIPGAPAPHWQVVDAAGNAYLLPRLLVANDRVNRSILVPSYVPQVAKVQIYCAFAEVVLGEAKFSSPVQ